MPVSCNLLLIVGILVGVFGGFGSLRIVGPRGIVISGSAGVVIIALSFFGPMFGLCI